jgi:hypothetical protein
LALGDSSCASSVFMTCPRQKHLAVVFHGEQGELLVVLLLLGGGLLRVLGRMLLALALLLLR